MILKRKSKILVCALFDVILFLEIFVSIDTHDHTKGIYFYAYAIYFFFEH